MHAAPDFAWLLLTLPYFAALGLFVVVPAMAADAVSTAHASLPAHSTFPAQLTRAGHAVSASGPASARQRSAQALAVACAAGLLADHAFGVLLADLRMVALAGGAVGIAGATWALLRHEHVLPTLLSIGCRRWLFVAAAVFAFGVPILHEPLQAWDARSIWFFHARHIYFDGGLDLSRHWVDSAYAFSHADYPKLLPLLAAQFAAAFGTWNEYLPKASLLALLVPVVLALAGLSRRVSLSAVVLVAAILFGGRELAWNGYADAWLAMYAAVGVLFVSRWLAGGSTLELAGGITFIGVALNLKNEGALVVACVAAALVWHVRGDVRRHLARLRKSSFAIGLALLAPVAGYLAWAATRHAWGLSSDLQLGAGSLARAWERVGQGEWRVIAQVLLFEGNAAIAAALFGVTAVLAWALNGRLAAAALFPAAVAALHLAGIFLVYLSTPQDLHWHLATSADRTSLVAMAGFAGSIFLLLETIETPIGTAPFDETAVPAPGRT